MAGIIDVFMPGITAGITDKQSLSSINTNGNTLYNIYIFIYFKPLYTEHSALLYRIHTYTNYTKFYSKIKRLEQFFL